eukprot:TRINITY_DN9650_c0_g1_i1.p2 TRINITY_DN9650_c0_g1~~TRINITY_DN9650_c0_g1_i1.p2  ORF type:complete len:323 (+),score=98.84 TRINITY_DN9650_c0_g1_i1:3-971(+)
MSAVPEHCPGTESQAAGHASACQGCPNQAVCQTAPKGPDPDLPAIQERMAPIKHKLLVLSGKGGVGKSTLTKELGFAFGAAQFQVGIVDADLCGPSMPRLLGVAREEVHQSNDGWEPVAVDECLSIVSVGFLLQNPDDAVTFRGPQKNSMIKDFIKSVSWGPLDLLLVDTPPGTSDEHLSLATLLKGAGGVDGAVVVTSPQDVAIADVRKELNFCRKAGIPVLGVVENMSGFVCPNCSGESDVFRARPRDGGLRGGERLAEEFGIPFLGRIPLDPRLMQSCEQGESLAVQHPQSPAVAAVTSVAAQLRAAMRLDEGRLEFPE